MNILTLIIMVFSIFVLGVGGTVVFYKLFITERKDRIFLYMTFSAMWISVISYAIIKYFISK